MLIFDIAFLALSAMILLLWTRGVWRLDKSDFLASGVLFGVLTAAYSLLYRATSLSDVLWVLCLTCAVAAAAVVIVKHRRGNSPKVPAILLGVALFASCILFISERQWLQSSNSILAIAPYRSAGTWVFDEPRLGLRAEPFVSGVPEMIDALVADAAIPDAGKGFRLIFSAQEFPGSQTKISWRRYEAGGNWYYSEQYDREGWLCPALFKFFKRAPSEIYVRAEALSTPQSAHADGR